MYKLIIVEDEENIRSGFLSMIDWNNMGFEVVADFGSGREALEFVEKNSVDVVLTDIKLGKFTGIDLAKEIRDRKLEVQIVFISGYKEFEFARSAIAYNVANYLLKPVRLDELDRVFRGLKEKLDAEDRTKYDYFVLKKQADSTRSFYEEQFLYDLVSGAITSKAELDKRLGILGRDFLKDRIGLAVIELLDCTDWKYGMENVGNALKNIVMDSACEDMVRKVINYNKNRMVVFVCTDRVPNSTFTQELERFVEEVRSQVDTLLQIKIAARVSSIIPDLLLVPQAYMEVLKNMYDAGEPGKYPPAKGQEEDAGKRILEYIFRGDIEGLKSIAQKVLDDILLSYANETRVKNELIKLVSHINNKIMQIARMDGAYADFDYSFLLATHPMINIRQEIIRHFTGIAEHFNSDKVKNDQLLIARVVDHIKLNYHEDISLGNIAEDFYISPSYLSRLFKEYAGEHFIDHITNIRIEKAKEFLEEHDAKVYEVCEKVGYSSQKYFSRLFRQCTGMTPTEYQKLRWNGNEG